VVVKIKSTLTYNTVEIATTTTQIFFTTPNLVMAGGLLVTTGLLFFAAYLVKDMPTHEDIEKGAKDTYNGK